LDEVHASVLARFAHEIGRGQVKVLRARSEAAEAEFDDNQLDWAWIDGDHRYDAVKADLEAFARVVRPGGYLAGDDYTIDWWGNDVIRAVDEFVAAGRGTVEIIGKQHFLIKLSV
jgi:cephalosporin hydroxylase